MPPPVNMTKRVKSTRGAPGGLYFISFLDLWSRESNEAVTSLSLTQTCRHRVRRKIVKWFTPFCYQELSSLEWD